MKERPILFSAPMVHALLAGTKTQTRRIVKHQPPTGTTDVLVYHHPDPREHFHAFGDIGNRYEILDWAYPCPYGQPGDRLYVRETWQHSNFPSGPYAESCDIFYRADYMDDPHGPDGELSPEGKYRTWRPSIHMPRAASRILLEICHVRVERLHQISADGCIAEGVEQIDFRDADYAGGNGYQYRIGTDFKSHDPGESYSALWEKINGAGSWEANPFVWVVEFRRI